MVTMNRLPVDRIVSSVAVLAVAGCCVAIQAADDPPRGQPDFQKRLEAIDRRAASIDHLTARFVEHKYTALLKRPMVSKGQVRIKATRALWETFEPHRTTTLVDDELVRIHYPRRKVVEVYPLDDRMRQLFVSPIPRLAALRNHFSIESVPLSEVPKAFRDEKRFMTIRLTPKDETLRGFMERADVVIDTTIACAVRVDMIDADGERTVLTFSKIETHKRWDEHRLDLVFPEGTKIVYPLTPNARPNSDGTNGERQ